MEVTTTSRRPLVTVVTPCYNEEENVEELCERLRFVFDGLPHYHFEQIIIDNASTDRTVEKVKAICAEDRRVKLIVNTRNFGHIRSPYYALLQARGDVVIGMASDLQDPPEMIPQFLERWEKGFKVVIAVKSRSEETPLMFLARKAFYLLITRISEVKLIRNFTGFGLYDQAVIRQLRAIDDPYPYFRGTVAELGYEMSEIEFVQPRRKRGLSANNFYILYDIAMLGITRHSKLPLRLATISGFILSFVSFATALVYLIYKLVYWYQFPVGIAPLVVGAFMAFSVQLFFIGLVGEYIHSIHSQVLKRPLVVEKERVNFDPGDDGME